MSREEDRYGSHRGMCDAAPRVADETIISHGAYSLMRSRDGVYRLSPPIPGAAGVAVLSMLRQLHEQLGDTLARVECAQEEAREGWSKYYEARGLPVVKEED